MGHRKFLTTVRRRKKGEDGSKSKEGLIVVERRKHPRISVELPMDYSLLDHQESHGGVVANISEGGLLVYLPEALQIGSLLTVEILFVKGMELTSIKGIAKIAWSDLAIKAISNENRYGLEFQSFTEGDLDQLKKLLIEIGKTHHP